MLLPELPLHVFRPLLLLATNTTIFVSAHVDLVLVGMPVRVVPPTCSPALMISDQGTPTKMAAR